MTQEHKFKPMLDYKVGKYDSYNVSITDYSGSANIPGAMVRVSVGDCDMTMHTVSADDLRKLAFLFGSMAEHMERKATETATANNA